MTERVDLALLLGKASEFARQWQTGQGCNTHVLDDLAAAVVSYLGDNPQLAQAGGEALLLAGGAQVTYVFKPIDAIGPNNAFRVSPLGRLQAWLEQGIERRRATFDIERGRGLHLAARVVLEPNGVYSIARTLDEALAAVVDTPLLPPDELPPAEVKP